MCQVQSGAFVSLLAPQKPTIPLATQKRLPRIYYTNYLPLLRIRMTDVSQLEKKEDKGKKRQESEKTEKERKENQRQEKQEKTRQEEEAREGKEKKCHTS